MKNISNMLGRGNLTVREKFLLLIHNDVQKAKTGKEVLTEADKAALENWTAKTNEEAREWNQLNAGWKLGGRMDLEAEFAYKDAQVAYLSQKPVMLEMLFYPLNQRTGLYLKNLEQIKKVTMEEAAEIARRQKEVKLKEGLDFDYAVYQLAFELLDDKNRERMTELYPDIETDHQYLDQEEIIAHLYGGQKELDEKAKEKIAELVAEQSYNKFAEEYQLFHYFACIPILEVAKYFLKNHGIEISGTPLSKNQVVREGDEDLCDTVTNTMQKYADEQGTDIKSMLRDACRQWLNDGLLEEYTPLAVSNNSELLSHWFKTKTEARKILNQHIASGQLAVRNRTDEETRKEKLYSKGLSSSESHAAMTFFENVGLEKIPKDELEEKKVFETFNDKVITGESLYSFRGEYEFVEDFKKRADTYEPNLGIVYAADDPEHKGDHLDQELVICSCDDDGEPMVFSQFGLGVKVLSSFLNSQGLFKEYQKDGQIFLKFKIADVAAVFKDSRQKLIDGYATLLGFESVFKKLSSIYETDMADHVSGRIAVLREYIGEYNRAIDVAVGKEVEKPKHRFLRKTVTPFEEDLVIDIEAIQPDPKVISENEAKMREVFPGIYS
ncbi:MAG: hypothetical protein A3J47_01925 [Candidatus Yanofskybacteria bacterium RIFCSPHIGHO2_02_FULL_43_22]|uniref:Uncharacterized protein n=1 Tax=Candidatus Yanofskybacteria bacterium RIFCSPHIGHO2_02_FULL_43_22 TaxID=1802681 RepID=A0A1F8FMB2_9BACT|nr:MAG: hypothetical protein A3J47_01925 [Candidatus Yanofskybacteria bacterium RIFCSPHIGHO2_02_FULL_43_22]